MSTTDNPPDGELEAAVYLWYVWDCPECRDCGRTIRITSASVI